MATIEDNDFLFSDENEKYVIPFSVFSPFEYWYILAEYRQPQRVLVNTDVTEGREKNCNAVLPCLENRGREILVGGKDSVD